MSHTKGINNPVSRLAPTPSGYLHIGNAYSFVLTALLVRANSGSLHLRIDDIDAERSRTEYFEDIFRQLDWLELDIDTGPSGVEDFKNNYSQHLHLDIYSKYIQMLVTQKLVFACQCSRSQVAAASTHKHLYPGTCRTKNLDVNSLNYHLRYNTKLHESIEYHDLNLGNIKVDLENSMGDFTVRRKGGLPAYQIVSVVEDMRSKVNLIVRGADLINSSAAQIAISRHFNYDLSLQAKFLHHPLIADDPNSKLSKSHGSLSLQKMRDFGTSKSQVYVFLAKAYGFNASKITNFKELLEEFKHSELNLKPVLIDSNLGIKI